MDYVWLALLFPLAGFAVNVLLGAWLPRRAHGVVATIAIGLAFLASLAVVADLLGRPAADRHADLVLYQWVAAGDFHAALGAWLDPLSALMLLVVTAVGFLIHLYAIGYMADDEGQRRFFAFLNLFVLAMLTLVLADNFMLLLVGWGGVGFVSYALIAHYYQRPAAAWAAVEAFVVNTIGDVGMMLGMFLIWGTFRALDYATVFAAAPSRLAGAGGTATAITLLLLVGAVAKSGQLPLHVWLPDAMEGPTPVSALIHAATMVTAGVYLLARVWPLYEQAPATLTVIAWLGAITALFAATVGMVQPNIKRVLAYSTISQLGYMFLAAGVGAYSAGIFHLMTHAFFKALLFLAAGAVIHAIGGGEDLAGMGGLRRALPVAYAGFLVGGLAISGIPPFSGFFSKDEIIWAAFTSGRGNWALGIIALVTGGLTGFYVFRAFFLAFHGASRVAPDVHLHAPGPVMRVPLLILTVLAFAGGFVLIPNVTYAFDDFLEPAFAYPVALRAPTEVAAGWPYWGLAILAAVLGAIGVGAAYLIYVRRPVLATDLAARYRGAYRFLLNRYYIDNLYAAAFVRPFGALARFLGDGVDHAIDGVVDGIGVVLREASFGMRDLQSGYVRNYALVILGGVVLLVAYVIYAGI
ncbi:MAG TPA: NADH-quinone oxidoreductase subunit L [Thermomicrobiales bacterium]|nr:NADH-quinone oxidoreductase subunit L [Thermomicrobiales bacterium]